MANQDRQPIRISLEPPDDEWFRRALDAALAEALPAAPRSLASRVEEILRRHYPLASVEVEASDRRRWRVRRTGTLGDGDH